MAIDELTPTELNRRIENGERWQLLDVREDWELAIACVPSALHIVMNEIPDRQSELDPAEPIAVMCHSGVRSARVAEFLSQAGFSEVANLAGGIDAWSQEIDGSVARY